MKWNPPAGGDVLGYRVEYATRVEVFGRVLSDAMLTDFFVPDDTDVDLDEEQCAATVRVLLFTVTFHTNLAHSLTRSP